MDTEGGRASRPHVDQRPSDTSAQWTLQHLAKLEGFIGMQNALHGDLGRMAACVDGGNGTVTPDVFARRSAEGSQLMSKEEFKQSFSTSWVMGPMVSRLTRRSD